MFLSTAACVTSQHKKQLFDELREGETECCDLSHLTLCCILPLGLLDNVTVLIGIAYEGKAIAGVINQPFYNYQVHVEPYNPPHRHPHPFPS